jgi:DNA-binding MarR family transcriptional regulator
LVSKIPGEREKRVVDDDEPGLELVHLLRGLTVQLNLFGAEFAATHRLHPTDLRALIELLDADRAGIPATPGWLGERLGLNSASVTGLVDRLERTGHVRRERDERDRRRVLLRVTEPAVALGWAFFGPLITGLVTATRSLDAAELEVLRHFLRTATELAAAARGGGSG